MAFTRNIENSTVSTAPVMGQNPQAQAIRRAPTGNQSAAVAAAKPTDIFSFVSGGEDITITLTDIKDYFCPNATDEECVLFGQLCKANGLNPWLKEAYLIKYDKSAPAAMVTGKDAYMKRADEHPAFDGYEAGVKVFVPEVGQVEYREGTAFYAMLGEELIGGWAKVYRKDRSRPYYEEVPLKEYDKGQSKWKEAPATMIRKVALVHALREAFPTNIQGMYDADEVSYAADYEGDFNDVTESVPRQYAAPRQINASAAVSKDPLEELSDEPIEDGDFK